jgi:hypothetical protein
VILSGVVYVAMLALEFNLLLPRPEPLPDTLEPVAKAIERCAAFQAVLVEGPRAAVQGLPTFHASSSYCRIFNTMVPESGTRSGGNPDDSNSEIGRIPQHRRTACDRGEG